MIHALAWLIAQAIAQLMAHQELAAQMMSLMMVLTLAQLMTPW